MGSGRGAHEQENPRRPYATGLRTQPALVVRGSSRRITIMRLESANIRVINRRHSYLDRDPHRFPRAGIKPKPRSVLTGRSISGTGATGQDFRSKWVIWVTKTWCKLMRLKSHKSRVSIGLLRWLRGLDLNQRPSGYKVDLNM